MQVQKRVEHPEVLQVGQAHCKPAVASDDSVVAVGSSSGALLLLDMQSGVVHSNLLHHTASVTATAWNARSEDCEVVVASADRVGSVVFWQAAAPVLVG
jgi:WD40 repeat protein